MWVVRFTVKRPYDDLKCLIDYLQLEYDRVTEEWMGSECRKVNLKRFLVADIDLDGEIYRSILEYVKLLSKRSAGITLRLSSVCSCHVAARIKTQNSIEYKISSYKTLRKESGQIPINKCINDLFGVRIFLVPPLSFGEVHTFVERTYGGAYRCIDSSKAGYRAAHLYFKSGNLSFPWELQIWNMENAEGNFASHKKYKQDYTVWEKESGKGGTING